MTNSVNTFPARLRELADDLDRFASEMDSAEVLRAVAAEKEGQEPVGEWVQCPYGNYPQLTWKKGYAVEIGHKLYLAPQPVAEKEAAVLKKNGIGGE